MEGKRVVAAPFIRATWLNRDEVYRRRRQVATAVIITLTVAAVVLSVTFVAGLARPRTVPATLFSTGYGLLILVGLRAGRRWLTRVPARPNWTRDGGGVLIGAAVFLLMPILAGFGLAILPALLHRDFPGERRARELTDRWQAQNLR